MSLTAADVAEIMKLVEQSSFDELVLEIEGMKLTLRRGAAAQFSNGAAAGGMAEGLDAPSAAVRGGAPSAAGHASGASAASANAQSATATGHRSSKPAGDASTAAAEMTGAPQDPNLQAVPAPLLGTFYRAPKPGAPPFIDLGATVTEETVIGIIEVMKLMNTVRAGVRGTVTEILARDGELVEYGETLLRVRKTG